MEHNHGLSGRVVGVQGERNLSNWNFIDVFLVIDVFDYERVRLFILNCRMLWTSWQTSARRRGKPLWSREGPSSFGWCPILQFSLVSRRRRTGQGRNSILKQRSVASVRILRTLQRKISVCP